MVWCTIGWSDQDFRPDEDAKTAAGK